MAKMHQPIVGIEAGLEFPGVLLCSRPDGGEVSGLRRALVKELVRLVREGNLVSGLTLAAAMLFLAKIVLVEARG